MRTYDIERGNTHTHTHDRFTALSITIRHITMNDITLLDYPVTDSVYQTWDSKCHNK